MYAITVVLIFPPLPPSTQHPHFLRQYLYHCSCPWVMCKSSLATPFPILFFTSQWLFCNYYLYFLILTLHPWPYIPSFLSGNHQNILCIHDSFSVLLVCLVCFLHAITDLYVFAILLFIVLIILFFLNKSL